MKKKQVMIGHSLGMYHSVLLTNMGLNMGQGSRRPYYPAINSRHILSFLDFEQAKIYAKDIFSKKNATKVV